MSIAKAIIIEHLATSPAEQSSGPILQIYSLDNYRFIEVSGVDAEKFLQGQSTCDFKRLQQQDVLRGAHCNAKGRMMSSFIAGLLGGKISLRLHQSIGEAGLMALKKYSVFSKVNLALTDNCHGVALAGSEAVAIVAQALCIPLTSGKFVDMASGTVLAHDSGLVEIRGDAYFIGGALIKLQPLVGLALNHNWDGLLVTKGLAEIRAETCEAYIPQMLNFHLIDGISFKKGCYTGQEIVARMQYLGKLKKHLYSGRLDGDFDLAIGQSIRATGANEAQGEVVLVAKYADYVEFLAVVNDVVAGRPDAFIEPLTSAKIAWHQLPYAIP